MRKFAAMLLLIACLFSTTIFGQSFAGQFEDAEAAFRRGDYETLCRLIKPLARKGDAEAQYLLGDMYFWGIGVEKDSAKAEKWYRKAAEQGLLDAQYSLGLKYRHGVGVKKNEAEAAKWYRKAAEQGHANAQFDLGFMYVKGQGVARDFVLAHMWYDLAASRFVGGKDREKAAKHRDDVASKMTPSQIAEAQKLAREWQLKQER